MVLQHQRTYTELHKFDAVPIVQTLSFFFSSKVFPKQVNAQDNGPVKIVNIYSDFYYLCLMHANEIITLSLTFKGEFGIGQLLSKRIEVVMSGTFQPKLRLLEFHMNFFD